MDFTDFLKIKCLPVAMEDKVTMQCMGDESVRTLKIFTADGNITTLLYYLQCSSVQSSAVRGRGLSGSTTLAVQ